MWIINAAVWTDQKTASLYDKIVDSTEQIVLYVYFLYSFHGVLVSMSVGGVWRSFVTLQILKDICMRLDLPSLNLWQLQRACGHRPSIRANALAVHCGTCSIMVVRV